MEVVIMLKNNTTNYTKALYVVDMVNGFVREGVLHDNKIEKTIPDQIKLLERFKGQILPIILAHLLLFFWHIIQHHPLRRFKIFVGNSLNVFAGNGHIIIKFFIDD